VLVMISNMSVPMCNRFHTIQPNNGKITSFKLVVPLFDASFEENLRTQEHEILSRKTRDLAAAHDENFVILACTVLTQYSSVTDRQTNRRTNGRTETPRPWLRRAEHSAIARRKQCLKVIKYKTQSVSFGNLLAFSDKRFVIITEMQSLIIL